MRKGENYKEPDIYQPADTKEYEFFGTEINNPIVCSTFGCKNHLKLTERLMGNICFNCSQKTNDIQPSKFVQY